MPQEPTWTPRKEEFTRVTIADLAKNYGQTIEETHKTLKRLRDMGAIAYTEINEKEIYLAMNPELLSHPDTFTPKNRQE